MSLIGIGLAAVVQPIAGRISDLAPLPDRRRPFIVGGTVLDLLFLLLLALAPGFVWLLAAYVLLQISSNFAQAAYQALIPDLVRPRERGLASGVKNGLDLLGGMLGLLGVGLLLALGRGLRDALLFIALVLGVTAALTVLWVPSVPGPSGGPPASAAAAVGRATALLRSFVGAFRTHRIFALTVAVRFVFLLGVYPIQRFLLFYLQDRFGLSGAAQSASLYVLAALALGAAGAITAGAVSDELGRTATLGASIVASAAGLVGVALAPSLAVLAVCGSLLATGSGAFQGVNWALLSDHIPSGRGAQFYGLANIATAAASALAGLYGPLVDLTRTLVPIDPYKIAFSLAALFALASLLPLRQIPDAG